MKTKFSSIAHARLAAHKGNENVQEGFRLCAFDLKGAKTFSGWRDACEQLLTLVAECGEAEVVSELNTWIDTSYERVISC